MKKLLALTIAALFVAPMAMAAENHTVDITGFAYDPEAIVVNAGDTVTWTNSDGVVHTVTDTSGAFDSGDIAASGSWSYVFTDPGDYGYTCTYHPSMQGSVFVVVYSIPSITTYGLALLALLLIVTTVYVLRRKKAGAVA